MWRARLSGLPPPGNAARRMSAGSTDNRPAGLEPRRAIAQYDRLAGVYDLWAGLFEGSATRRALSVAGVRDGEDVLEVATGTGVALAHLAQANRTGRTIGLDASRPMAVRTRRRAASTGRTAVALADCRRLPFLTESFDVVYCSYLLDLLSTEDMERAASEFLRILRPGGRLVLVCMTHDGPLMRAWGWLYGRWPQLVGGCRSVLTTPVVERAGFTEIHREVVRQLGFPSEIVTARR